MIRNIILKTVFASYVSISVGGVIALPYCIIEKYPQEHKARKFIRPIESFIK